MISFIYTDLERVTVIKDLRVVFDSQLSCVIQSRCHWSQLKATYLLTYLLCLVHSNVKCGLLENCSRSITKLRPADITSVRLIDYFLREQLSFCIVGWNSVGLICITAVQIKPRPPTNQAIPEGPVQPCGPVNFSVVDTNAVTSVDVDEDTSAGALMAWVGTGSRHIRQNIISYLHNTLIQRRRSHVGKTRRRYNREFHMHYNNVS